ncbi:MAG: c-type cytochrome [Ideonella sp.]|nr:c-type cytochrome [Ideonella sp.]
MRGLLPALALAAATALAAAAPPKIEDSMAQRLLACTGCHGKQGRATSDGYIPRLAGKPAGYLLNQLHHFRDGRRQLRLMTGLLDPLDDAYLAEIAAHFAALDIAYPPPQAAGADRASLARGEQLALRGDAGRRVPACSACHGAALTGTQPAVPGLLGLPRDYLNAQLGAWRGGNRRAHAPDCMASIARRLAPDDVAAVAHWLAAQPVPAGGRPAPHEPAAWPLACGGVPQRHVAAPEPAR